MSPRLRRWLTPGIGVKRWLLLIVTGLVTAAFGLALTLADLVLQVRSADWGAVVLLIGGGTLAVTIGLWRLGVNLLAPYRRYQQGDVGEIVYSHSRRGRGMRFVALGGGTGLPSVLRAMKPYTNNITAIVTVADDGGSSGRLRRELGVLPPGDLRNNIAALADDESLMTRLFQYRFDSGDLGGHAFGNLFIAALSGVAGGLDHALVETGRVLNIQGRVLPSTLDDIRLVATVRQVGKNRAVKIQGEAQIAEFGGQIESVSLLPEDATAYEESVRALLEAELIIIGPGSLYTSILPNLMVREIAEALRAAPAYKVYICNVATQPGETEGFNVADHVMALERHVGRGVFQAVLANNAQPTLNAGENTHYVPPVSPYHEIAQRYDVRYRDLTDPERPWRHDPQKLARAILEFRSEVKAGG